MRNAQGRLAAIVRAAGFAAVALSIAGPASAQFGGLKKKVKSATAPATERYFSVTGFSAARATFKAVSTFITTAPTCSGIPPGGMTRPSTS